MFILVTGGSGSGKSAYAESRVLGFETEEKYYIATMQVYGEEGERKVERHRKMRAAKGFETIESPCDIQMSIGQMIQAKEACILVECVSNLIANEMFTEKGIMETNQVTEKVVHQMRSLISGTKHQVVVTNNVFEDGIQYEETTMNYMKALGQVNVVLAALADEVVESVVGIPVRIK